LESDLVDITGKKPTVKIKTATLTEDDYAVVTEDGSKHYPINTWDLVKQAEDYFQEERIRLDPEIRRQFAVNLTKKAAAMGYPLEAGIVELGSESYAPKGHLKAAIEMRKVACAPRSEGRKFLDELFEKTAELQPEVYAECLKRFDIESGLNSGWDQVILDPWASTYGIDKTANVVWESATDRVTDQDLCNLALNHGSLLQRHFACPIVAEFQKHPVTIFESMPIPQKKILARMAQDVRGQGISEGGPNSVY
jgi:hypothetical protein